MKLYAHSVKMKLKSVDFDLLDQREREMRGNAIRDKGELKKDVANVKRIY